MICTVCKTYAYINWSVSDGKKNRMIKSWNKDRESNRRITNIRVYWRRKMGGKGERNGKIEGGWRRKEREKGRERERRAGPPNESPEKRRRWEYWSGMPATGCLERSPLPSLPLSLSLFLPSFLSLFLPMYTNFSFYPFLLLFFFPSFFFFFFFLFV